MFIGNAGPDPGPGHAPRDDCKDPGAAARLGAARAFARNEVIFWEGDSAANYYRVANGAVRLCKLLGDGRRQVVAFHVIDEIFGFERHSKHAVSAEAISDSSLIVIPVRNANVLGEDNAHLEQDALGSALLNLERAQRHTIVLGRMLAPERIATFLLDLAERFETDVFDLPMSRIDIGDYLGLTIETVSRTLSEFSRQALIRMPKGRRNVAIRDRPALVRLRDAGLESA